MYVILNSVADLKRKHEPDKQFALNDELFSLQFQQQVPIVAFKTVFNVNFSFSVRHVQISNIERALIMHSSKRTVSSAGLLTR